MRDFKDIRERWDHAAQAMSEQKSRMLEDLRFSNPADPQQWDEMIRQARTQEAMPCYTFDQTNQFISQVVNDSRMNKPQIQTVPASSGADQKVSDVLDGMIRQIEYASDAAIAYDVAQEAAARTGRGWFRLLTEVQDVEMNLQELRIRPVIDSLSVVPGDYTMPDGSDMGYGFVENRISRAAYDARYGSSDKVTDWSDRGDDWFDDKSLRIAEYFEVVETRKNHLRVKGPDGKDFSMSEDDYWKTKDQSGVKPGDSNGNFTVTEKKVRWYKLNGDDFIEEDTVFPGKWIPLFPVHGYETWIEGKRFLCGMVRRMMDAQRAYNMERSAYIQMIALQPKAPYILPFEAMEGLEQYWSTANTSNRAALPYNHLDGNNNPLPPPQRMQPPNVGSAYAQNAQMAQADLQASVGMYRANLGAPSNETSGVAIKRREQQGDTANFHYIDNLARTMGHCGRVIVGAIPTVYADSSYGPRDVRTLGVDGTSNQVIIDPDAKEGASKQKDGTVVINPSTGNYDVRVKVGPAYANLREELSQRLTEISQGNPQLGAALAPLLTQMMDMPESEKISKICLALLPPQVQQAYQQDDKQPEIPPQVMGHIQQLEQQLDMVKKALMAAHEENVSNEQKLQSREQSDQIKAQSAQQIAQIKAEADQKIAMFQAHALDKREQDKHVRGLEHASAASMDQQDAAQVNAQLQIQLQAMRDQNARIVADIASQTTLLSKLITPPPQVTEQASKEPA